MVCPACMRPTDGELCRRCAASLRPIPTRVIGGAVAYPVFHHGGAAACLVHELKYRRSISAGRFLAAWMATRMPSDVSALVPVPRVTVRRIQYGIDQTAILAQQISGLVGTPVLRALQPPMWAPRSAGRPSDARHPGRYRMRSPVPRGAVLIDDVITTGATARAAADAVGWTIPVLAATAAGRMDAGTTTRSPEVSWPVSDG